MSDQRVLTRNSEKDSENKYCTCKELHPCSCINHPPYHCGVCSRELTPAQLEEARSKGWYPEAGKVAE